MYKITLGATALALIATTATSGGIERSSNDYGFLFTPGSVFNLGHAIVTPSVSGEYTAALGGGSTGNMSRSYGTFSFAAKHDLSDKLAIGLYHNQAYGANAAYAQGVYTGLTADWQSKQTSLILKYQLADRVSVFGGMRYVLSKADITIPELLIRNAVGNYATDLAAQASAAAMAGDLATAAELGARATTLGTAVSPLANPLGDPGLNYSANGAQTGDFGYTLGVAYEIPDIALRVALTYESAVTHAFDTFEMLPTLGIGGNGTTEITMPQSLALDFQTGIAAGTLLFGGVKWTEWSAWEVRTPGYESVTGDEITGFANDVVTWKLGVGKQFNDNYSAFAQITYEAPDDEVASRLAPTDGRTSLGLGGQFTEGPHKLRVGMEYVKLGDATDSTGVQFKDNSAWGVGVSYTASF
ncbi:outer membrane protein transport protein [Primorskyibacter sp. 2E107]|uniref:outer membrane protein transport protein n=1 Tax=Primorskyibacter sp. 2E107 TaxID=3403458 RepID=UPI003AF89705